MSNNHQYGFTLIEVLVVCALMCILASVSLARLNVFVRDRLLADCHKLSMAFTYMQHVAMMEGDQKELIFNNAQRSYSFDGKTYELSKGINFGILDGVQGPPCQRHRTLQTSITYPHNKVIFYQDGKIQPGAVYLVDDDHTVLYALTIAISNVSYIRIYSYSHGAFKRVE